MAKKKKDECKSIPAWLTSFGDLMSLLLTFFILLFSMGTISLERFQMVIKGVTEALGGRKIMEEQRILNNSNINLEFPEMYMRLKKRKTIQTKLREVQNILKTAGIESEIETHGVFIRFRVNSDKMFPIGSAIPYKNVIPYIMEICKRLKILKLPIVIEGHTDNTPIRGGIFKNNLELSAARALTVLKFFVKCGYDPKLLAARGYGPYRPIAPNDTPEGKAKNRRIEFLIQTTK